MKPSDALLLLTTFVQYGKIHNPSSDLRKLFDSIGFKPRIIEHTYGDDSVYFIEDLKKLTGN